MEAIQRFGLKEDVVQALVEVFERFPQIRCAVLYGSRAKGNYRPNSDIDISLKGKSLDLTTLMKIETALDDLLLPYKMDLSLFHKLENKDLVEHINRVGVVFYEGRKEGI